MNFKKQKTPYTPRGRFQLLKTFRLLSRKFRTRKIKCFERFRIGYLSIEWSERVYRRYRILFMEKLRTALFLPDHQR